MSNGKSTDSSSFCFQTQFLPVYLSFFDSTVPMDIQQDDGLEV